VFIRKDKPSTQEAQDQASRTIQSLPSPTAHVAASQSPQGAPAAQVSPAAPAAPASAPTTDAESILDDAYGNPKFAFAISLPGYRIQ
jgi:hypothetical protein